MTNDSVKYWRLIKRNENILEKKAIVWMFDIKHNHHKYFFRDTDSLILKDTGDKLYSNDFFISGRDSVYINSYAYGLSFISKDSLVVKNQKSIFTFKPEYEFKYIDSTKPKTIIKIGDDFFIK